LNENKGGHILIEIAKAAPEINFLGVRGSYWKQIEDPSVKNIRYMNNTPHIKEVYALSKVLIMPSKDETWGRTAVEAMSSGIPVIAAPTPGLRECCEDSALFVERNDIPEWVRLIRRLINDKAFYDEYSNRGKIRARQLEPTHDLEMFKEWYETKVIVSTDRSQAKPLTLIEEFYDRIQR
jgi:glycosyltransferase involved in cell wall biosynthesis